MLRVTTPLDSCDPGSSLGDPTSDAQGSLSQSKPQCYASCTSLRGCPSWMFLNDDMICVKPFLRRSIS